MLLKAKKPAAKAIQILLNNKKFNTDLVLLTKYGLIALNTFNFKSCVSDLTYFAVE
jgi:hypothetical protein